MFGLECTLMLTGVNGCFLLFAQTNGASVPVTVENIENYTSAILDYTLRKGIERQVDAFREGQSSFCCRI
jgi:hypothetical protein